MGEWGTFYYGRSCPKWSVTGDAAIPCIRYGELYTKFGAKIDKVYSYTNMSSENLRFSKGTEVLIPRVGENPMDYNHCTWLSIPNVAIGEMISVFNTDNNPLFTAIMFNATLQKEFAMRVEGGSVTNLYFEKLKNIEVLFPSIEEQEKIAEHFKNIDSLITFHHRKSNLFDKIYKNAWEQRKFSELGSVAMCKRIFKEQTSSIGDIPFYKIGTFGSEPDAFISRELFEEYKSKFQYPKIGDMLISASGTIGRTVEYTGEEAYFQDSNIVWFKHDERIDNSFLKYIYAIVKWSGIEGSTIKRLYNDNFLKTKFYMPSIQEQTVIGSYFNNLDNLITLHQRKCDETKKLKKCMLQKMFPKDGEKVPEIRFSGFTGDWKQRKLGEVFEQTTSFVNPDKEEIELWSLTVEDGLTPKSERYNREFLVKKNANFKKVRPGDIVYNPMNMTLGAVGYNGMLKNVAVSGYYITMFVKTGYDSYYINTWLKSPQAISLYKTFATGSLIEKQRVQFSTLSIIPTVFPEYEEQKRIGCYFNNLDSLITFHQQKCDELKNIKKFMLQNMFVQEK